MDIFDRLPKEDVELLNRYINYYGGSEEKESYMELSNMPYFLRFWKVNKMPFFKMFGEQFILKREICFDRDPEQMEEDLDSAIRYGDFVKDFRRHYINEIYVKIKDFDMRYELNRFVEDVGMLIKNEYDGEPFCIPGKYTVDKHPLQINKGAKAVKTLGKICKALGIEKTGYYCPNCGRYHYGPVTKCECCYSENIEKRDGFEMFRRTHSLALNQKKIKGNLCLSIHPLDFITMSDNACCWASCMSWVDEPGDYRLGTIEMMNSPYVVIAYVEAKELMHICRDDTWNNKRWRQLLVITPEMILGNKQYPFFNDDLQGAAMKWLRDLANNYHKDDIDEEKFGPYASEALQIKNHSWNTVGQKQIYVNFNFDYMYNDIYDYRLAFIANHLEENRIEYNLSGPAVCTTCGEVIYKYNDEVEPSWTTCRECNGMWKCANCGDWHYGEPYYCEDSDEPYCEYCWRTETEFCEVCGERVTHTEKVFIQLIPEPSEETESYNWNFTIDVCSSCIDRDEFKELFGPISYVRDMYGRKREVVFIENITDRGIERGDLPDYTCRLLREVRDAKSPKDRVELLRENLY